MSDKPRQPITAPVPGDARQRRSRQAILDAFFRLVQERSYDELRVAEIVALAKVGRSTFYDHFAGKADVLAHSIAGPFSILARVIWHQDEDRLEALLDHFQARREQARALFTGTLRRKLVAELAGVIEGRLQGGGRGAERLIVPTRLAAVQLAGTLLTPIVAWLEGDARCTSRQLALLLHRVSHATLIAMTTDVPSLPAVRSPVASGS